MSLREIMRQREEKLERWRELGVEPYAYRYQPTHSAADVLAMGEAVTAEPGERVRVAGRVMSKRGHGKAGFAHLLDGSGRIQVYGRADVLGDRYERFTLLDVGDWAGVEGPVFRTRSGEITIAVESLELLAKSMRPLPEKWHGLKDPDTRFRQRYADLFMNAEVRETFRRRTRLTAALRAFLDEREYLEVETPVLQPIYGGAFARPFTTRHHALGMELFLRISNELYLKRLIVGGFERVYEFARDFRNEGIDRTHSPEFTMLEFYQAFADVHDMMDVTEAMLGEVLERVTGSTSIEYQGQALSFAAPWPRVSMLDAVSEKVGESVHDLDRERLARLAKRHHVDARKGAGAGALVDELFGALVQPDIVQPTFIVDFPVEISPLARVSRENPNVVERFEVVVAGHELGNAFSEQNDPRAQAGAFEGQAVLRAGGDEEAQVMDEDYIRALEYGMPPTGGCGIGFDRLVMLATDARNIREVVLFPTLRPEEGRGEIDEDEEGEAAADPAATEPERA